jgi:hypothetical protein
MWPARIPESLERSRPALAALAFSRLKILASRGDTAGMARKPEPPKPIAWGIYKIAAKAVWLGNVEAPDEATAIDKGAAEFKVAANRLMAIRR